MSSTPLASQRFSGAQRALHWTMSAAILTQLFIGVGMVSTITRTHLALLGIHQPLGLAILVLALARLALRLRRGSPPLPADLPAPMRLAAVGSHWLLYALMLAMPLIGWTMQSAAGNPVVVCGLHLPALVAMDPALHALLRQAHTCLGFTFYGLILAHLAAALFHLLVRRDGVFQAMA